MNKLVVSLLCVVSIGACQDNMAEDPQLRPNHKAFTKGDLTSKVWQISKVEEKIDECDESLPHPNERTNFEPHDIFVLREPEIDREKVDLAPTSLMEARYWDEIQLDALFRDDYPYLCGYVRLDPKNDSKTHLVVMFHPDPKKIHNIDIIYKCIEKDENCTNVSIPIHGGLAHAHAVR